MNQKIIITLLILIFLAGGTYLAIRYAQGYRVNLSNQVVEGTGLLVANSHPQGASVLINDELKTATDDTLHLTPGNYKVRLEKDGYKAWEKQLQIKNELVTQTNARLFPAAPSFSALTYNGASDITPSPDGHKLAFKVATGSAETKYGIWVLSLDENPLRFSSNAIQIAIDEPTIAFSEAQLFWSPNSSEILAYFNENRAYLLNASNPNKTQALVNVAFQLPSLVQDWQEQLGLEQQKRLTKLPLKMQEIATSSATLLYFSPSEEKLLYTATASGVIPEKLIPPLPAINDQTQERNLKSGSIYVYDSKEDTNFLVVEDAFSPEELDEFIQKFTPPSVKTEVTPGSPEPVVETTPLNQPVLEVLQNLQAQYSPVYSHHRIQWFPDSYHLIITEPDRVCIVEYDGNNKVAMFTGYFLEQFTYPWPNGQKLVLLTPLSPSSEVLPNLYALDLE